MEDDDDDDDAPGDDDDGDDAFGDDAEAGADEAATTDLEGGEEQTARREATQPSRGDAEDRAPHTEEADAGAPAAQTEEPGEGAPADDPLAGGRREAGETSEEPLAEGGPDRDPETDAPAAERGVRERWGTDGADHATAAEQSTDATETPPAEARSGQNEGSDLPRTVDVAVVTVSRDRTHDDDPGCDAIEVALAGHGHDVVTSELVRPAYDSVQQTLDALVDRADVDTVVTNGATGVTRDDVTVEALHPIIDKALPGFGEVFRSRYYEAVGTDVVASRATAGIADGTPVFCLPADPTALRLGVDEIVAQQAPRIVDAIEAEGPADE